MEKALTSAEEFVESQLKVHHRDAKTGVITKEHNYIRHCHRDHGVRFERDGKVFYENWTECKESPWFTITTLSNHEKVKTQSETLMKQYQAEQQKLALMKAELEEEKALFEAQRAQAQTLASGNVAAHEAHKAGTLHPSDKPQGGAPQARSGK